MRQLRVLMSAYACEPGCGSESGIGWNLVEQASRFHQVWVITRANNRQAIEAYLQGCPLPNVRWVYFDLPRWARFWKRGARGARPYYYLWQVAARRLARRLHAELDFDVTHHATFGTYWLPAGISALDVPFVWGPVGGGELAPTSFYRTFSLRGFLSEHLRDLARGLAERDPRVRSTARKSHIALAATEETAERLRHLGAGRVMLLSHVALPERDLEPLGAIPLRMAPRFRLVTIGRLLHWKGVHLGIEAFACLRRQVPDAEYWIIGDGPERSRLERLARRLGVAQAVWFRGTLDRPAVFEALAHCDVLLHPSFHDSGGYVCAEAMAAGRPMICLDLGGPAMLITSESGVRVPVRTPEQIVADLTTAAATLATNRALLHRLGTGARLRVQQACSWEYRGDLLDQLYRSIVTPHEEAVALAAIEC